MPCAKDQTGCRAGCLHRQLIAEYRDAADARESLREAASHSHLEPGEFEELHPPLRFGDWLVERRRARREAERHDTIPDREDFQEGDDPWVTSPW